MQINIPQNVASLIKGDAQQQIIAAFYSMRPGAMYRVNWVRPLKILKKFPYISIIKGVSAMVRAGIDYNKINDVQEKRETGELPKDPQPLPWGQWVDFPRIIAHKDNLYLRLYPFPNKEDQMEVSFVLNNGGFSTPCTAETAKNFALASEFQERESLDCFTLKLPTIQYLSLA